ncbi:hypothetical protein pb186bvf_013389 [Paramecium bursaria]
MQQYVLKLLIFAILNLLVQLYIIIMLTQNKSISEIQSQECLEIYSKLKIYMDQIFVQIIDDKNSNQIQLKSLCQQLQIMRNIINNLNTCRFSSKRELYYQNLYIFENQEQVNKIIQQISYQLQVRRKQLKIVSASKGLVCGALQIETSEMILDLCSLAFQGKGMNITEFMDECIMNITGKTILVVEKETVYFRILQEQNIQLLKQIVLITGKGYPCVATKCFIKLLQTMHPQIPICYLGDHDPHGFQIYLYYKYGNEVSKYEYNNIPQMTLIKLEKPQRDLPINSIRLRCSCKCP